MTVSQIFLSKIVLDKLSSAQGDGVGWAWHSKVSILPSLHKLEGDKVALISQHLSREGRTDASWEVSARWRILAWWSWLLWLLG